MSRSAAAAAPQTHALGGGQEASATTTTTAVRFLDAETFAPRYQRNNKKDGLKNLRCFPTCAALHRERGFCGRPVRVEVLHQHHRRRVGLGGGDSDLVVIGEFAPADETEAPTTALRVGQTVDLAGFASLVRDDRNPKRPWLSGVVVEPARGSSGAAATDRTVFEFNSDKKGYHYGWASNKHSCNAAHVLQAYVLERQSTQHHVVAHVARSPAFMIFCRRRRRFVLTPAAPVAPPKRARVAAATLEASAEVLAGEDDAGQSASDSAPRKGRRRSQRDRGVPVVASAAASKRATKKRDKTKARSSSGDASVAAGPGPAELGRLERMLRAVAVQTRSLLKPPEMDSMFSSPSGASAMSAAALADELASCVDFFPSHGGAGDSLLDVDDDLDDDQQMRPPSRPASGASNALAPTDRRRRRDGVVSELARFLVEEREFTDAIHTLASSVAGGGDEDESSFGSFVSILRTHLDAFLARQGLTEDEFDALVRSDDDDHGAAGRHDHATQNDLASTRLFGTGARGAFRHVLGEARSGGGSPDGVDAKDDSPLQSGPFSGAWRLERRLDAESGAEDDMEELRTALGQPWLLRRMLSYMEGSFVVEQTSREMRVRLRRKLFSSGCMVIRLDGEEHPWGMSLPMFQGLAKAWSYRAWIDPTDGTMHHLHDAGEHTRMRRALSLSADGRRLTIRAALERWDGRIWIVQREATQRAVRVVDGSVADDTWPNRSRSPSPLLFFGAEGVGVGGVGGGNGISIGGDDHDRDSNQGRWLD